MPGVSAGKDGAAMMQPGLESREMSPGDCGSLKTKPSLAMLRNMKVNIIGTSVGRSTAPGAKEFCTLARAPEKSADRLVRAAVPVAVVDSDIAGLRCLPRGFVAPCGRRRRRRRAAPGRD